MFYRTKLSPLGHKAGCYWESGGSYKQSGNLSMGVPVSATLRSTHPGWPLLVVRAAAGHSWSFLFLGGSARGIPREVQMLTQSHRWPRSIGAQDVPCSGHLSEQTSWESRAGFRTLLLAWLCLMADVRVVKGALGHLWEAISETGFLTFEGASLPSSSSWCQKWSL